MDLQFWAPIVIPLAAGIVGTGLTAAWRRWQHDEQRELRRIYRRAALDGPAGPVRDALLKVVTDDAFHEWLDPPEAQSPAGERVKVDALVREQLAGATPPPAPDLDAFFRRVHRGLAGAHNQRWKDRGKQWDVAPVHATTPTLIGPVRDASTSDGTPPPVLDAASPAQPDPAANPAARADKADVADPADKAKPAALADKADVADPADKAKPAALADKADAADPADKANPADPADKADADAADPADRGSAAVGSGGQGATAADAVIAVEPVAAGWEPPAAMVFPDGPATIGRGLEHAAVADLLTDSGVRLVTLTGPGGVGKTRLGRDVAAACAREYDGLVYWADLTTISAHESFRVASVIARTLRVQPTAEQIAAAPAEQDGRPDARVQVWLDALVTALADRRLLLVLDNFEQVVEAAGQVAELLERCPRLRILATSRRPLRLLGLEHEYPVRPLTAPDPATLPAAAELPEFPAVALFLQRVRQRRPDFELTADQAPAVARICHQLDGLPYLIEVAAALLKYYGTPVDLQRELIGLDHRVSLGTLVNPGRNAAPRRRDPLAMLAWSYELLSPAEQRLFRRLGIFVGEFDFAAIAGVGAPEEPRGQVRVALGTLIDDNLVHLVAPGSSGQARYRLLETTREGALLILEQAGEVDDAYDAHARYFLHLAMHTAEQVDRQHGGEGLGRVADVQEDIRAAFGWLRGRDTASALQMAWAVSVLLDARGRRMEARDTLEMALAPVLVDDAAAPVADQLRALDLAGLLATKVADCARATRYGQRMLQLSRRAGRRHDMAEAMQRIGRNLYFLCQYDGARKLLGESAEHFRELGDRTRLASVAFDLGAVLLDEGRYAEAHTRFEESLRSLPASDRDARGRLHVYLAFVSQRLDRPDAVAEHLEQARQLLDGQNYHRWYLHFRGRLQTDAGDLDAARESLDEAMALFRERGDQLGVIRTVLALAFLAARQGRWSDAVRLLAREEALRAAMDLPFPPDWVSEKNVILQGAERHLSAGERAAAATAGRAAVWTEELAGVS